MVAWGHGGETPKTVRRANQNAERLHGAHFREVSHDEQSAPMSRIPYNMPKPKSNARRTLAIQRTIDDPFRSSGGKWPDERTAQSASFVSTLRTTIAPAMLGGLTGTNKSFAVIVPAVPNVPVFVAAQASASGDTIQDISLNGTSAVQTLTPTNVNAINAVPAAIRCCGIGARLYSLAPNLQRGGRYFAGLGAADQSPITVPSTGTQLSPLSTFTQGNTFYVSCGDLVDTLKQTTSEVVGDQVFEAHWKPAMVPEYSIVGPTANSSTTITANPTGTTGAYTALNALPLSVGHPQGQNYLVLGVHGDVTSSATATTNPYDLDIVWHWEYVPVTPRAQLLELTPSPCDSFALDRVLTRLQLTPVGVTRVAAVSSVSYGGDRIHDQVYSPSRNRIAMDTVKKYAKEALGQMMKSYVRSAARGYAPPNQRRQRIAN